MAACHVIPASAGAKHLLTRRPRPSTAKIKPANDLPAADHFLDPETLAPPFAQFVTLGRQSARSSRPKSPSKALWGGHQAPANPAIGY